MILLSCAANICWDLYQLDVKTAFLYGDLEKEVYMDIAHGFSCQKIEGEVGILEKGVVWLKTIS